MSKLSKFIHVDTNERAIPFGLGQRVQYESYLAVKNRINDVVYKLIDLQALKDYMDACGNGANSRLTYAVLFIKAIAEALKKYPRIHYMKRFNRIIVPSTIDIGVSVYSEEALSPVVVIRDAGNKDVYSIAEELRELTKQARAQEKEDLEFYGKFARLLPLGFFRRAILRLLLRSQRFARSLVGTFQLSTMHTMDIDFGITSACVTTLLIIGGMRQRPMVVEGQVMPRTSAYFMLHANHGIMPGKYLSDFLGELQRILHKPEELLP